MDLVENDGEVCGKGGGTRTCLSTIVRSGYLTTFVLHTARFSKFRLYALKSSVPNSSERRFVFASVNGMQYEPEPPGAPEKPAPVHAAYYEA